MYVFLNFRCASFLLLPSIVFILFRHHTFNFFDLKVLFLSSNEGKAIIVVVELSKKSKQTPAKSYKKHFSASGSISINVDNVAISAFKYWKLK